MNSGITNETIIVLDDDPMIEKLIAASTRKKTHLLTSAKEFQELPENLNVLSVFVDIHLGTNDNGLDLLQEIKARWPFCPVIVITGDQDDNLVGAALAAGADDFIQKPIKPKEMIARMQARMGEMAKRRGQAILQTGDISIDLVHRVISNPEGHQRYLSPTEMNLLRCLLDAHGTVVPRDIMKRKCWGQIYVSDNALNRKLHEVRQALKDISRSVSIKTIYGTGFSLKVTEEQRKEHHEMR